MSWIVKPRLVPYNMKLSEQSYIESHELPQLAPVNQCNDSVYTIIIIIVCRAYYNSVRALSCYFLCSSSLSDNSFGNQGIHSMMAVANDLSQLKVLRYVYVNRLHVHVYYHIP